MSDYDPILFYRKTYGDMSLNESDYSKLFRMKREAKLTKKAKKQQKIASGRSRIKVNTPLTIRLYELQAGICYLCKKHYEFQSLTRDHVMPRSKGGVNRGNLLLACEPCNNSKGNRLPSYEELIYLAQINEGLSDQLSDIRSFNNISGSFLRGMNDYGD